MIFHDFANTVVLTSVAYNLQRAHRNGVVIVAPQSKKDPSFVRNVAPHCIRLQTAKANCKTPIPALRQGIDQQPLTLFWLLCYLS